LIVSIGTIRSSFWWISETFSVGLLLKSRTIALPAVGELQLLC